MENLHLENDDLEPFRSKLYFLDAEGGWLDQGTGYPLLLKEKEKDILKFTKEETGKVIYQVEITNDLQFDQQEEKIFTWFSESTNTDIALSFQNEVGAETLWQKIQEILSSKKRFFGPVTHGTAEDESLSVGSESGLIFEDFTLTLPQEDKLAKFEADLIKYTTGNTEKKNLICHLLCTKNIYLENLFGIFQKAEEEQDEIKLTALFRIFRHMISMAYYDLYSLLLDDEYYLKVFGILEYDTHPEKNSIPHRKYFQEHINLKPITEISDPEILKTIHWNFRLIYLRDYVLGHHLDERILQFISAIIQSNYIDIIKYIQTSKEFLTCLFDLLRSQDLSALKMIHEICVVIKNLEVDKIGIFQLFSDYGLFEILEEILTTPPPQISHKTMKNEIKMDKEDDSDGEEIDVSLHLQTMLEIIMLALVQAPLVLREYCASERQKVLKYPLMTYMTDKCTTYPDLIIQSMLLEAIKHLIDIADGSEESSLLRTFYDQQLGKILKIYDNPSNDEVIESGKSMASDLLIYCAKQQMNELKRYLIPLDIVSKIIQTFRTNSKFLILQTVQFYKLLLKCKEPEIISLLVNPLGTITNYFMNKCKDKWNLLHSSILEIFHIILQEEIFVLLKSIIKGNYKKFLDDPNFADLSEKLKDKYTKLNNGEFDLALEERKQSDHSFTYNSRKGSGNFSLESPPSGGGGFWDNSMKKPSNSSPKHGENREKSVRRTCSNMAKSADYDGEMEFNNETRGKEPNFMIEDIHVKKRKLDEIHSIKILNKTSHSNEVS